MKKTLSVLAVMAVIAMGAIGAYAQFGVTALPGGGWWEASQVMNVGTDTANVAFEPILGLGVPPGPSADPANTTIAVGASYTFMPGMYGNLTMDDGYKGSAIVSADQPIVAIGQVANNVIGDIGVTDGRASAMYPGISQDAVATTVAFPLAKNDYKGKTTTFYVQTIEAGTIYATYSMNEGANTYTAQATTTEDGQMATFSPSDVTTPSPIPSGCSDATCLGAVTFTSTVQLAGIYVEHNTSESPAQILMSTRGFTLDDYDDTVVIPNVKSLWKGRTTGIQIMNVGSAVSTITFTLAHQSGSATTADGAEVVFADVPVGASVTYFPGNHTADDTLLGPFGGGPMDEFLGAATITSDQPMVSICSENDFAGASTTKQTTYAGFAQAAGTDTVLFPLVKEDYKNSATGLQIMNVGDAAVTLSADYVFDNGSFTVDEDATGAAITVDPGAAFTFYGVTASYWNSGAYSANYGGFGAVTVSATGTGTPMIVGIAQEAVQIGGTGYLDTKNYEGFNQ